MIKVLFVCLGNICRSKMAEYMFKDMLKNRNISNMFLIDSAGTSNEEYGNPIYYKAKKLLLSKNIEVDNKTARKMNAEDYNNFDYIIAMEKSNIFAINRIVEDKDNKVKLLLDFSNNPRDISDPWYHNDFEKTFEEIKDGLESFLKYLGY